MFFIELWTWFCIKLTCLCYCQIRRKLTPILGDAKAPLDVVAFTAIALGFVYVGSCNEEIAQAIIFALMDRSESELGEPLTRLLPLGLGLLYLGKQVLLISFGSHGGRYLTVWEILELGVIKNSNCFWNPLIWFDRKVWMQLQRCQRHFMKK